jgi:FMN-dependent NADH-azoreductase
MKTLLVIRSSLFGHQGQSSQLLDAFETRWREHNPGGRVLCRDLAADPIPHLNAETFSGFRAEPADRTPAQQAAAAISDALIAELKMADEILLAVPMYNFTVPSTFKAWMDHVARAGVTFQYTEDGPAGLLDDRRVVVVSTRGGHYLGTSADTQTGLVRGFLGLLGLKNVEFVHAEGLAMGPDAADTARDKARTRLESLVAEVGSARAA